MERRAEAIVPRHCDRRIRAIVDYWCGLPATALSVPARRDFDPLSLPPRLLRHIWMVDIEREPERFRFRLCGSHLVDALGFDPVGRYYDEVFPDFIGGRTHQALSRVRDTGEASWRSGESFLVYHAHDIRELERVFLALTLEGERVDIVLAASIYRNRDGREI